MRLILFSAVLIITIECSAAETCPTENLTSSFASVRGHGGAEWCWANAISDLIGFSQGVKPPDRISAVDVGVSYFNSTPESLAKAIGMPSKFLPQEYRAYLSKVQDNMKDKYISEIPGSPILAAYAYQSHSGYCLEKNVKLEYADQKSYIFNYINSLNMQIDRAKIFDCINETDSLKKLQIFRSEINKQILAQMNTDLEVQCEPRTSMRPMKPFRVDLGTDSLKRNATDLIKTKLNARTPVGIAFDSDVLFKDTHGSRANHIAIVTEARLVNGQCQYRIRDAQGTDCNIYRDGIKTRCENGNIWLTTNEINTSTEYLMGIEKF